MKEVEFTEEDKEKCIKAVNLIEEMTSSNPDIKSIHWMNTFVGILVYSFKEEGYSYESFKHGMNTTFAYYKGIWDE